MESLIVCAHAIMLGGVVMISQAGNGFGGVQFGALGSLKPGGGTYICKPDRNVSYIYDVALNAKPPQLKTNQDGGN